MGSPTDCTAYIRTKAVYRLCIVWILVYTCVCTPFTIHDDHTFVRFRKKVYLKFLNNLCRTRNDVVLISNRY